MAKLQNSTQHLAVIAGLATFAALAGSANAQMNNECTAGTEACDQTANSANFYISEASCAQCGQAQVIADNFLTDAVGGTLNNIVFRGGYFPSNSVPATDTFSINLYKGSGTGVPDFNTDIPLPHTVTRALVGVIFGVDEYEYVVDLGCNVNLDANTEYWLEIYNNTLSSPDDWFWETGNPGNGTVSGSALANSAPGDGNWSALAGQEFSLRVCVGCDVSINSKYCLANNNSTGAPADLTGSGGSSASSGTITMTSAPVPNQVGLVFFANLREFIPFNCSFQCIKNHIVRSAVIIPSGNVATYVYDNSDAIHSLGAHVGSIRRFQYWYRDPMNAANCGGFTINTSNAVEGVIAP